MRVEKIIYYLEKAIKEGGLYAEDLSVEEWNCLYDCWQQVKKGASLAEIKAEIIKAEELRAQRRKQKIEEKLEAEKKE